MMQKKAVAGKEQRSAASRVNRWVDKWMKKLFNDNPAAPSEASEPALPAQESSGSPQVANASCAQPAAAASTQQQPSNIADKQVEAPVAACAPDVLALPNSNTGPPAPAAPTGNVISDALTLLLTELDIELVDAQAAEQQLSTRLHLVSSLLDMMPDASSSAIQSPGAGLPAGLLTGSALTGMTQRLSSEHQRAAADLDLARTRVRVLQYAQRQWQDMLSMMRGVSVDKDHAGPLQALIFKETLARITTYQEQQHAQHAGSQPALATPASSADQAMPHINTPPVTAHHTPLSHGSRGSPASAHVLSATGRPAAVAAQSQAYTGSSVHTPGTPQLLAVQVPRAATPATAPGADHTPAARPDLHAAVESRNHQHHHHQHVGPRVASAAPAASATHRVVPGGLMHIGGVSPASSITSQPGAAAEDDEGFVTGRSHAGRSQHTSGCTPPGAFASAASQLTVWQNAAFEQDSAVPAPGAAGPVRPGVSVKGLWGPGADAVQSRVVVVPAAAVQVSLPPAWQLHQQQPCCPEVEDSSAFVSNCLATARSTLFSSQLPKLAVAPDAGTGVGALTESDKAMFRDCLHVIRSSAANAAFTRPKAGSRTKASGKPVAAPPTKPAGEAAAPAVHVRAGAGKAAGGGPPGGQDLAHVNNWRAGPVGGGGAGQQQQAVGRAGATWEKQGPACDGSSGSGSGSDDECDSQDDGWDSDGSSRGGYFEVSRPPAPPASDVISSGGLDQNNGAVAAGPMAAGATAASLSRTLAMHSGSSHHHSGSGSLAGSRTHPGMSTLSSQRHRQ